MHQPSQLRSILAPWKRLECVHLTTEPNHGIRQILAGQDSDFRICGIHFLFECRKLLILRPGLGR
jgi:hypothetical protein